MKSRLYFLDNLRTFLIFLVVVLHSGLVYESALESSWIVVDLDKANNLGLLRMYLDIFVMFSLFYISGYFINASVESRSTGEFIKSKFNRIIVPWLVGVLTLIPIYKSMFLYSRGLPQENWQTYFHIFTRSGGNPYFFADNPVQNWLWYLPVLFTFQIIYLAMYKSGIKFTRISIYKGFLLSLLIGLVYSIGISKLNMSGWYHSAFYHFQKERLIPYFLLFLMGVVSYRQSIFSTNILNKKLYIWFNIALTLFLGVFTIVALNLFFNLIDPQRNYYFISPFIDTAVYHLFLLLSMFSFLYILLYSFRKYFDKTGIIPGILNSNSYYVYIIHMVVIGALAIPLMTLDLAPFFKFLLLVPASFIISNVLVYFYKKYIDRPLSNKWIKILILIITSFVVYQVNIYQCITPEIQTTNPSVSRPSIFEAAISGDIESINYYCAKGENLNQKEPAGGSTPLIVAAMFDQIAVCEKLLKAGAEINLVNNEGSTAFLTAVFFGRTSIVKLLLEFGADREIKNNNGNTATDILKVPIENLKEIYNYFISTFGPMGFKLDFEELEKNRIEIFTILAENE